MPAIINYYVMENTFSIEGLWAYIQSLSLSESNRNWLIDKLKEPAVRSGIKQMTKEDLIREVRESQQEFESGKYVEAQKFKKELHDFIDSL